MNMNDFQRLAIASMGEAKMMEHVRNGVRALGDHAEEAKDAAEKMDHAPNADVYIEERQRLEAMMGFVLVDVAEICEGLDALMGDVAMENLEELLEHTRKVPAESGELSPMGLLGQIFALAGKAVNTNE